MELGFEKPTFAGDGSEIARDAYSSITAYIDTWSGEPSGNNILLLGDFGAGKTWITLNYSHLCLEEFWKSPIGRRVPVYIPLRHIDPSASFPAQAAKFVGDHFGMSMISDPHAFASLNRSGKLLLFLDGFDEWGTFVDEQHLLNSIRTIASLLSSKSKILLTSRGHFFKSSWHAQDLFSKPVSSSGTNESLTFEVMRLSTEVSRLTDSQVRDILDLRLGKKHGKLLMDQLASSPNLRELVSRPLLLNMMVQILEIQGHIPNNTLTLYETYTEAVA